MLNSADGARFFALVLLRFMRKMKRQMMSPSPIMPPTTPPTIAGVSLLVDGEGGVMSVDVDWVDDDDEVAVLDDTLVGLELDVVELEVDIVLCGVPIVKSG